MFFTVSMSGKVVMKKTMIDYFPCSLLLEENRKWFYL